MNAINRPEDLKFNITDCKLYVPAVTLIEKYENFKHTLKTGINTGKINAINPGNDNDMYKNTAPFFVS